MTSWQVTQAVVDSVLKAVEGHRTQLDAELSVERLDGVTEDLAAAGPVAAELTDAVNIMLNGQRDHLTNIGNRVSAGAGGVDAAAGAYRQGNEEMAAEVQAQMIHSAVTGDFTWWYGSELPEGAA